MKSDKLTGNFAYIDNQNLYMATHKASDPWEVDMRRLRVYLKEKYHVIKAYLFMGAFEYKHMDLYARFQEYGYVLIFREHGEKLAGKKKGNVDVDIVFEMMRDSFTSAQMESAVLVSGDGDYYRTVSYLNDNGKLACVILPSRNGASSLYKKLTDEKRIYFDNESIKRKIGRAQK